MLPTASEKFEFDGATGARLAGRLERPRVGEPLAYALFAHCFTCSKDIFAAARISRALAERGIAVLRFDFTGLGGSEGDFANTDFSSNVGDLVKAAESLASVRGAPRLLIGHSLGGAAVLAAAARLPEVAAVATIGAPSEPAHVTHLFDAAAQAKIARDGAAEVCLAGRPFTIRREFLEDVEEHRLHDAVRGLGKKALLVFHSPVDEVVGIDHARRIYAAAEHPKSFVSLDDADHLLTRAADSRYVASVLAAWAARYLDEGVDRVSDDAPAVLPAGTLPLGAVPAGMLRVAETGEGKFAVRIDDGRHVLRGDEPASVGGDDAGPSPYEFLLASLGSCTVMTLRMYAMRKQWPLERAVCELRHEKRDGVDHIERRLILSGPLDDAQRARLLEIAEKCPVHRTLHGEVRVETRF